MRSWDLCARGSSPSSCGPLDRTVFAVAALYIAVDHVAGLCVDETPRATAGRNGCVHRNMLLAKLAGGYEQPFLVRADLTVKKKRES